MTDNVTISDERGVRLIVLNRPEKKNALTQAMYAAINDAIAGTDARGGSANLHSRLSGVSA
jgi:enoyl-CoA hydratase/carnithine racemase